MASPVSGPINNPFESCKSLEELSKVTNNFIQKGNVTTKNNRVYVQLKETPKISVEFIRNKFEELKEGYKGDPTFLNNFNEQIQHLERYWQPSIHGAPYSPRLGDLPAIEEGSKLPISRLPRGQVFGLKSRPKQEVDSTVSSPGATKVLPYGVESRIIELVKEWKQGEDKAFASRGRFDPTQQSEPIVKFLTQFNKTPDQFKDAINLLYKQTIRIFEKDEGAQKMGLAKIKMKELFRAIPADNYPEGVDSQKLKKRYT